MDCIHNDIQKVLDSLPSYTVCTAIIDTTSIQKNYMYMQNMVSDRVTCSAVVKADAYGFGAQRVSTTLQDVGCSEFFVATVDEGIEIREVLDSKSKIFVLGGVLHNTEQYFSNFNLIPVLVNIDQVERWKHYAYKLAHKLPCIIHVDTGMARNGLTIEQAISTSTEDYIYECFDIEYIMSHFACADDVSCSKNMVQFSRFNDAAQAFHGVKKSISSTNGAFLRHEYACDMVRLGKALYGFAIRDDLIGALAPVMQIYARIVQVNEIHAGQSVGYGATFVADRDMRLITIGMGYADGLMRKLSSFGYAYINEHKISMVGRISMDYAVFDVTDIPSEEIELGGWVSLANNVVTLERMAIDSGTIPHEITCKLGRRVKRVYV